MFRKLHWVAETVSTDRSSEVRGIYTSIPDLVRHGLGDPRTTRLTLTELDTEEGRLGTWQGPEFAGLDDVVHRLVTKDEFSSEQAESLLHALRAM